jgi:hypothetical protein
MRLLSGLTLGLAAGAAALPGVAGAAPDVTTAVTPSTANPGTTVTITGSCGAGVSSPALRLITCGGTGSAAGSGTPTTSWSSRP